MDMHKPVEFTKEMKKTYTILAPMMLPIHFQLVVNVLNHEGYKVELLHTKGRSIVDEGLKNVHNDTCYPALLVIGQLIDALKSGSYDPNKTALLITQTGGGCRASNYIYLLRRALKHAGFPQVPVISINFSNLEKHEGFSITPAILTKAMFALTYGDVLMWLSNQCKPYEVQPGATQAMIEKWVGILDQKFASSAYLRSTEIYEGILDDFAKIERKKISKIRVGIVGEIYMKYAPLGNNDLESFLIGEGAEPVVSGVMDFMMYTLKNSEIDYQLYGTGGKKRHISAIGLTLLKRVQKQMIHAIKKHGIFRAPASFATLERLVDGYIHKGVKMGEGWLLTSEMVELMESGVNNIVSAQPFGCLPNHIVAKGMMRKIKDHYPQANIVAIDYDPSATAINQENRLKLMLANAKLAQRMQEVEANAVHPVQAVLNRRGETVSSS